MNVMRRLIWKEWSEDLPLLVVAAILFLVMPLIGGVEDRFQLGRFEFYASPWVIALGGVAAIFMGCGAVCRDFRGRLEDFWHSRPIEVVPWLGVKYLIGLAITLLVCLVPLWIEIPVDRDRNVFVLQVAIWFPFLWAALYSIAFVIATLLRRVTQTAVLSIAAMLLLIFLPPIIPPLTRMGIGWVLEDSAFDHSRTRGGPSFPFHWHSESVWFEPRQLVYVGVMLLICILAFAAAVIAVRRDWRVEFGRGLMYWSIGSALLILFASAAFQVASNLPVLNEPGVSLPPDERADRILCDGIHGVLIARPTEPSNRLVTSKIHRLEMNGDVVRIGPPISVPGFAIDSMLWRPKHPDVLYGECALPESRNDTRPRGALTVVDLQSGTVRVIRWPGALEDQPYWGERIEIRGDRLYLPDDHGLFQFDITRQFDPKALSVTAIRYPDTEQLRQDRIADGAAIWLPPIPEIPARDRLVRMVQDRPFGTLSGDLLIEAAGHGLRTYRLDHLTDLHAVFRPIGKYIASSLESFYNNQTQGWIGTGGGFVYISESSSFNEGMHISAFDIHDPEHPRLVGHFARPYGSRPALCALPDGRVIVGSERLYVLGRPPGF